MSACLPSLTNLSEIGYQIPIIGLNKSLFHDKNFQPLRA